MEHYKKAQVGVLDLFISAVIFGILVSIIMFTWNEHNEKIEKQIEYNNLVIRLFHISDLLTQYHGKPTAWEIPISGSQSEQTSVLGLASSNNVIDNRKLESFLDMEYNQTKEIFNINTYEYYFKIIKTDGTNFTPSIAKGQLKNETVVSVRRIVIYNDEPAILQFQLEK